MLYKQFVINKFYIKSAIYPNHTLVNKNMQKKEINCPKRHILLEQIELIRKNQQRRGYSAFSPTL